MQSRTFVRHAETALAGLIGLLFLALPQAATAMVQPNGTALTAEANACGTTFKGDAGFPGVDLSACNQPDTATIPPHKAWRAIQVKPAVCVDWFLYHTNKPGSWDIFRLGEIDGNPKADDNISKNPNKDSASISPSRSPDGSWVV